MKSNPVTNHALSPNVRGARLPDLSGPLFKHLGHFSNPCIVEQGHNPAVSEKQRRFMGAELNRKRHGKKTQTGMSEKQLRDFATKE